MSGSRTKGSGLEWFVRRGGAVRGPFSSAKVRHFVLEGKLEFDDEVSADRLAWRRIGGVAEVVPLQMRTDDDGLSAEQDAERKGDRARATRTIAVITVVIAGLTAAVYFAGPQEVAGDRDCAAVPVAGVFLEGCRLDGAQLAAATLAGARLANASLAGANLAEADLRDADLRYADLASADLSYSRLNGAILKGANLRLADLTNADLSGADLSFADLSGARIGGAQVTGFISEGAIWTDGRRCGSTDCPR